MSLFHHKRWGDRGSLGFPSESNLQTLIHILATWVLTKTYWEPGGLEGGLKACSSNRLTGDAGPVIWRPHQDTRPPLVLYLRQTECGNRIESSRSISVVGKKQSQRQEEMGLNWKNRRDVCFLKFLIFRRYNQDKKERKSQILQEDWPRNQNLARNILPETSTAHKT